MIRITCNHCQKPLSLDETKLPMREVTFPCPVCKAKLTVDRREFESAPAAEAAPQVQPVSGAEHEEDDHANELGAKALMVGTDSPALRQAAKLVGYLPVFQPDAVKAREFFNQELPHLVFLSPPQVGPPPLDSIAPIVSVVPTDRRKSFFVLVADNLRTLDGNAAFLYGVNLVVATKDLPQFPQIYRDAHAAHERLYASMIAVLREKHG
jgi:hypothetical protein